MIEESSNRRLVNRDFEYLDKSTRRISRISAIIEKIHSINGLHILSASSQIFIGLCLVALSITSSIQPLWLATIMAVVGSIASVIGLYVMYYMFAHTETFDSLLHKAIKRVINFQN